MKKSLAVLLILAIATPAHAKPGVIDTAKEMIPVFEKAEKGPILDGPNDIHPFFKLCHLAGNDSGSRGPKQAAICRLGFGLLAGDAIRTFNEREGPANKYRTLSEREESATGLVLSNQVACKTCLSWDQRFQKLEPFLAEGVCPETIATADTRSVLGISATAAAPATWACTAGNSRLEYDPATDVVTLDGVQMWGMSGSLAGETLKPFVPKPKAKSKKSR